MKTLSSVSAVLVSVVAIASPFRMHESFGSPGIVTLAHLASPAKPVNGFRTTQNRIMETISDLRRSSAREEHTCRIKSA
jgi:hypothetical protein